MDPGLQPGETVSVNVSAEHWKFSGDEKKTNSYLYDWTQKFWLEKPNYLTGTVEMMFSEIPREQKVWPEPSGLYRRNIGNGRNLGTPGV